MNILQIGCGKMGGALLAQWVKSDIDKFTIVDPAANDIPLECRHVTHASELSGETFDMLIVAIKPQIIDLVLPAYTDKVEPDGFALSIAAGYSLTGLQSHLPETPIIRVMPNLPASIGRGVSALFADDKTNENMKHHVTRLMEMAGTAIWVNSEDMIDRFTAIAGSGPGFIFEIARTYVNKAVHLGFSETDARNMVLNTLLGSTELALQSDQSLEALRNAVTSKNGTTEAGLKSLNGEDSLTDLIDATLDAAYKRAIELR